MIESANKRIVEFDLARGVAIFLMILQHVWLLIFSRFFDNVFLDYLFFNLGTVLAAPVFLFLMGVNISLSKNNSNYKLSVRGVKLFFLGYLLSALRFFLPIYLANYYGLIVDPEKIIYHFPIIYYLLEIDILQLAGLSLIVVAGLRKIKLKLNYYLVGAWMIFLLAPFLKILNVYLGNWHYFIDPLFGKAEYVLFPLFPWLAYFLIGCYFGHLFVKFENKKQLYQKTLKMTWILFVLGLSLFIINPNFSYYHHSLGSGLIFTSIVLTWISILGLKKQQISLKLTKILSNWSSEVTKIYFFQWLLIAWGAVLISIYFK